jgi:sec-independent protein translocase protein TatB
MFGISWHEYMVIAVVALIVIGPKELPRVLRAVGQWTAKVRRMAAEFQGQFQEALREAEMADLKKEVDSLNDIAKGASDFRASDYKGASKQELDEELSRKTEESAAYPSDTSSSLAADVPPESVASDPPVPYQDTIAPAPGTIGSAPIASLDSPDHQAASAEPAATEKNVSAAEPNITQQAATQPGVAAPSPSPAVDAPPLAGAAAHDA